MRASSKSEDDWCEVGGVYDTSPCLPHNTGYSLLVICQDVERNGSVYIWPTESYPPVARLDQGCTVW